MQDAKCTICGADAPFATKPTDAERPVPRCRKHTNTKEAKASGGVHGSDHNPHPCEEGCSACPPSRFSEQYAWDRGYTSQAEMRGEDWS